MINVFVYESEAPGYLGARAAEARFSQTRAV